MKILHVAALAIAFTACDGCKSSSGTGHPGPAPGVALQRLTVTSKSFASRGPIPVDYTCDGADKSPQLTWSAPPAGTKSFAVLVDDPDAPGGDFTHWILFDIRPDALTLPEAADPAEVGAIVGTNGFNRVQYSGPCPPRMELHHYYFRVFALDSTLGATSGASRDAVDTAM